MSGPDEIYSPFCPRLVALQPHRRQSPGRAGHPVLKDLTPAHSKEACGLVPALGW